MALSNEVYPTLKLHALIVRIIIQYWIAGLFSGLGIAKNCSNHLAKDKISTVAAGMVFRHPGIIWSTMLPCSKLT